jgi:hypothetical protein
MTVDLVEFLRARLRNAWTWPVVFQLACWWEKRYRPERWQGDDEWRAIILPSGRATTRQPDETLPDMVARLGREDHPDYREEWRP